MDINAIGSLKFLENIAKVKQREVYCPMTKMRALVSPLLTCDDLSLRTTIASPDLYDQELSHLLWTHTKWPEVAEPIDFKSFLENISYIDRQLLIWGMFASTYGTLGKTTITCPHCGHKFEDDIKAEDLLQSDSITPWDMNVPYTEYVHTITYAANVENVFKLEFHTSIPTIKQHIEILRLIPVDKIKENYQKFGTILSKPEELAAVTRSIKMYKIENDPEPVQWFTPADVHLIISQFLTIDIADNILDDYNGHFNKYVPIFKKNYKCTNCTNPFNYLADPEVSLFRQFLRG